MELAPLFVLDSGREQTVIVGAWSWGWVVGVGWALLSGDSGFSYIPGSPWEMRSWKQRGGKWVEKWEARKGKSARDNCADFTVFHRGLPCLPLLTSKLSQRLCVPAQSALPAATQGRTGG